jgi:fibronectin-binding autotransporter adhesin
MAGVNTYTGNTTVQAGSFNLTGSLAGGATIQSTVSMVGTGSVAGLLSVQSGGKVTAGSATVGGVLSAGGLDLQSGSTLNAVLTATGTTSKIVNSDTSAFNVNLAGVNLTLGLGFAPKYSGGAFPVYTLIDDTNAATTVSGMFATGSIYTLTSSGVQYKAFVSIGAADADGIANDVLLTLKVAGDENGDGTCNFNDLLILQGKFNKPGTWAGGDFNGDNQVNFNDLLILQGNFNKSGLVSDGSGVVPEPATMGLLLLGGLGLLRRRSAK